MGFLVQSVQGVEPVWLAAPLQRRSLAFSLIRGLDREPLTSRDQAPRACSCPVRWPDS
jgi:hypothetical protein